MRFLELLLNKKYSISLLIEIAKLPLDYSQQAKNAHFTVFSSGPYFSKINSIERIGECDFEKNKTSLAFLLKSQVSLCLSKYLSSASNNVICFFVQIFYAVHAFQARSDHELSLQEYQRVHIIRFCDLSGNKEWWLAEAQGQKGYVPANYLGKMTYA